MNIAHLTLCPLLKNNIEQGGMCVAGGVAGFARTRSVPSLIVGVGYVLPTHPLNRESKVSLLFVSVGALYLYSADRIRKQEENGLEAAVGAFCLYRFTPRNFRSMPRRSI